MALKRPVKAPPRTAPAIRRAPVPVDGLKARDRGTTCPYCRDELAGERRRCGGCGAVYHPACAQELGTCGTLGCKRQVRVVPPLPHARRREEFAREQWPKSLCTIAGFLLFGLVQWLLPWLNGLDLGAWIVPIVFTPFVLVAIGREDQSWRWD